MVLDDDDFVERIAARANALSTEVPRKQPAQNSFAQYGRAAVDRNSPPCCGAYSLKAIGAYFGLHYTVSRIARMEMWQNTP